MVGSSERNSYEIRASRGSRSSSVRVMVGSRKKRWGSASPNIWRSRSSTKRCSHRSRGTARPARTNGYRRRLLDHWTTGYAGSVRVNLSGSARYDGAVNLGGQRLDTLTQLLTELREA